MRSDLVYARILVPTDGSPCADRAVTHGVAVARAMGSSIVFLFVMDTLRNRREGVVNVEEARQMLAAQGRSATQHAVARALEDRVRSEVELLEGTPADVILHRSEHFDLVVMGSHGAGALKRLTLGSVAQAVINRIARPLLVVRCPA